MVLRALGYDPSKEDVEKLVSKFDSSKTGALDFSEYMDLLIDKMVSLNQAQKSSLQKP